MTCLLPYFSSSETTKGTAAIKQFPISRRLSFKFLTTETVGRFSKTSAVLHNEIEHRFTAKPVTIFCFPQNGPEKEGEEEKISSATSYRLELYLRLLQFTGSGHYIGSVKRRIMGRVPCCHLYFAR